MQLRVKKLDERATLPKYQREGDAGIDLAALEETTLIPGEWKKVRTGLAIALPENHVGIIKDRSGLAARSAVHCLAGVFEETYRGEWLIVMINLGKESVTIQAGERCCQLVILPIPRVTVTEVETLEETNRGSGGFGSSGTH